MCLHGDCERDPSSSLANPTYKAKPEEKGRGTQWVVSGEHSENSDGSIMLRDITKRASKFVTGLRELLMRQARNRCHMVPLHAERVLVHLRGTTRVTVKQQVSKSAQWVLVSFEAVLLRHT